MSNPGSRNSLPRRRRESSTGVTALVLKRFPGCLNEVLDAICGFVSVDFDAAADVYAKRTDFSNRGADILRIKASREQEWEGRSNLFRALPIGTSACPSQHSLGVTVDENSHRGRQARSVSIDVRHHVRRIDSRPRPKC